MRRGRGGGQGVAAPVSKSVLDRVTSPPAPRVSISISRSEVAVVRIPGDSATRRPSSPDSATHTALANPVTDEILSPSPNTRIHPATMYPGYLTSHSICSPTLKIKRSEDESLGMWNYPTLSEPVVNRCQPPEEVQHSALRQITRLGNASAPYPTNYHLEELYRLWGLIPDRDISFADRCPLLIAVLSRIRTSLPCHLNRITPLATLPQTTRVCLHNRCHNLAFLFDPVGPSE